MTERPGQLRAVRKGVLDPTPIAGVPEANGVGSVRRLRLDKTATREVITRFDAPHHLSYEHLEGLPIRDYVADVTLIPGHQSTELRWDAFFHPQYPGTGPPWWCSTLATTT